ncbi:MAG: PAAR domain-containing protein [Burkholderia sp.]
MNRRAVRDGDPTTTGGIVIAVSSTLKNHGKKVALDGDKATCGNCKGTFPIVGSAHRMIDHGRRLALDGDNVLCPCGRNRLIASSGSMIFYGGSGGRNEAVSLHGSPAHSSERHTPDQVVHDEQYVLRDAHSGKPLANVRYRVVTDTGQIITSTTDGIGRTRRFITSGAVSLKIYAMEL